MGRCLLPYSRRLLPFRGVLFDLPHVVAGASRVLEAAGVLDHCEVVARDMFTEVPTGGDAYLLARVLWNWEDEQATSILQNCRNAIQADGKLLVVDLVLPDGPPSFESAYSDLNLHLEFGGRLRGEGEFRTLLERAGFTVMHVLREPEARLAIIEARPGSPPPVGQDD